MKLFTAIIREAKLDQVREALLEAEINRITVSRVSGHGQQRIEEVYRAVRNHLSSTLAYLWTKPTYSDKVRAIIL